jgi:alpha-beta hydrolase superfamily lysophospholipase
MSAHQFLYLHGFASGPGSKKGVAFAEFFAERGVTVERLNLRVPSFPQLRLSAMIEAVCAAITRERVVLVGSSLGGLTAARVAERDPRIAALVLLAPAFQLAARWRQQLGAEWADWERTGWREVIDRTTNAPARVDFGFMRDVETIDVGEPDVRIPTLILHGTGDEVVPVEHSRRFATGRGNVSLVELDDNHDLIETLPHSLAAAEAFLTPYTG